MANIDYGLEFNQTRRDIMNLGTLLFFCSQFLLKMNYCYDLWNISDQDSPFRLLDSQFDSHCFADLQFTPPHHQNHQQNHINPSAEQPRLELLPKSSTQQEQSNSIFCERNPRRVVGLQVNPAKKPAKNRKKRIIKPSPYHNYQKHLNSTLKQLIILPELHLSHPTHHSIAHALWSVFRDSSLSTKKILHFIFNEFNQYKITAEEVSGLGFGGIYGSSTVQQLSQAKNYLTQLTLSQLNEGNIDRYLSLRRIRNQVKFKKYLLMFRQELEDGFLKKRFTNRSRKELIKRQICQHSAI